MLVSGVAHTCDYAGWFAFEIPGSDQVNTKRWPTFLVGAICASMVHSMQHHLPQMFCSLLIKIKNTFLDKFRRIKKDAADNVMKMLNTKNLISDPRKPLT